MSERPPIPPDLWERMLDYLAAGKTGQLTFHAKDGRILALDLTESVRRRREQAAAEQAPRDCLERE